MKLSATGREFASWGVVGADADTAFSISFDKGATWTPLDRPTPTSVRVLVAGPAATANPAGTVVLATGRNTALIRATDNPEVVIRGGGAIDVV